MNAADTGFMMICSALVFLMVSGVALFYGGLVQKRDVLSTTMHSFFMLGIGTLVWALIGYSLAFGDDYGGLIGDLRYALFNGVGMEPNGESSIPHILFMTFQCMFACLTVALISGAYAERMRFSAVALFSFLWLVIVYSPLAHWVWGGGWMMSMGVLDFAGGAVVHMSSAAAGLACAHVVGPRDAWISGETSPHNLPMTILGAGLLWFGWFGFNAGSALAADGLAANAFATTQFATGAGVLGWLIVETMVTGKPTTLGAASGALAGLVSITPGAGFVTPLAALPIGFFGGALCYAGVVMKKRLGYDDALDVVGVHGVGGTWGALATGLFCSVGVNAAGADGLFYGNPGQFGIQLLSVLATWAFVYIASRIILALVGAVIPLRATGEQQSVGLDITDHNERGYQL